MSQTSFRNEIDKTEENGFDQRQRRKELYFIQLLFTEAGKKNIYERTPSRACLPSRYPLQKLKVVLMWSCLLG